MEWTNSLLRLHVIFPDFRGSKKESWYLCRIKTSVGETLAKTDTIIESYKTRIHNNISKWNLYDVIIYLKDWINDLEIVTGDLGKYNMHIDNTKMATHILSRLPEAYANIIESI